MTAYSKEPMPEWSKIVWDLNETIEKLKESLEGSRLTSAGLLDTTEKQGAVIKDLVKALEHIANFEGYLCASAKGYKKHCQKALNSIPKEML